MGNPNQRLFLERHATRLNGPVVEIGSRNHGNGADFRSLCPGADYLGVDLRAGPGVDLVHDMTIAADGPRRDHFALAICCSVLEHTPRPWVMAENITRLLRPGGEIYVAVPWVWPYHAFPGDYFRYSLEGLGALFPAISWRLALYSTKRSGHFFEVAPGADDRRQLRRRRPWWDRAEKYLPCMEIHAVGRRG